MENQNKQVIEDVKKKKDLQELIAYELNKSTSAVYQTALYRPDDLLNTPAIMRVYNEWKEKQPAENTTETTTQGK